MLCLTVICFIVGMVFVPDELEYYCRKAERAIKKGNCDAALAIGKNALQTNEKLTSLRAFALYKKGLLGEQLFKYPLTGGSHALSRLPADDRDRILCADLMDKELDRFARHLLELYPGETSALPRHYREALVLLSHQRSNPIIIYRNNVLEADYADYQRMEKEAPMPETRKNVLRNSYRSTYWYYYDYE